MAVAEEVSRLRLLYFLVYALFTTTSDGIRHGDVLIIDTESHAFTSKLGGSLACFSYYYASDATLISFIRERLKTPRRLCHQGFRR